MRAFRVAYDGEPYRGFQRQPHGDTIEDALFEGLRALGVGFRDGSPAGYAAAGRTDAGVSARAQTVAFEAPDWLSPRARSTANCRRRSGRGRAPTPARGSTRPTTRPNGATDISFTHRRARSTTNGRGRPADGSPGRTISTTSPPTRTEPNARCPRPSAGTASSCCSTVGQGGSRGNSSADWCPSSRPWGAATATPGLSLARWAPPRSRDPRESLPSLPNRSFSWTSGTPMSNSSGTPERSPAPAKSSGPGGDTGSQPPELRVR